MPQAEEHYTLHLEWEEGEPEEVAFLEMGREEVGRIDAIAVNTSADSTCNFMHRHKM